MSLTPKQVTDLTARLFATLKTPLPVNVIVAEDPQHAFGVNYDPARHHGSEGGYYPATRRLLLIASAIPDGAHLATLLRHEIYGHYALNTFEPADKLTILETIGASRADPSLAPTWSNVDQNYPGIPDLVQAEEVYSFIAETAVDTKTNLAAAVRFQQREAQRAAGTLKTYDLADLQHLAREVAEGIRNGSRPQRNFPANDHAMFRVDTPDQPAPAEAHRSSAEQEIFMSATSPQSALYDQAVTTSPPPKAAEKKPHHVRVAEEVIARLERGTAPWQRPWEASKFDNRPMNPTTGQHYKGINNLWLGMQDHADPRWLTYKQAAAAGAQVRGGESGTTIEYWIFTENRPTVDAEGKPRIGDDGKPITVKVELDRPRVRFSTVFNAEQIDGLPPLEQAPRAWEPVDRAQAILQASGATIQHGRGSRAFYRPSDDTITLPEQGQFASADRYYATALHELGHWTGHSTRLDRDLSDPFGSEGYAKEELRAEISSMMLGDELGIGHDPDQHASYVKSWIRALQEDPREIFRAAADAEKIQRFVLSLERDRAQQQEQTAAMTNPEGATEIEPGATIDQVPATPGTEPASARLYIAVPYAERGEAKAIGAKWDGKAKSWYVTPDTDPSIITKWNPAPSQTAEAAPTVAPVTPARVDLDVPYMQRKAARAAGAQWDATGQTWYAAAGVDLAKLNRWLPGDKPPPQAAVKPEVEFAEALRSAGAVLDRDHPIMDGKGHRVAVTGDKAGERSGFYVAHLDGRPAGYFIDNRSKDDFHWKAKGYTLSADDRSTLKEEATQKLADRAALLTLEQHRTADTLSMMVYTGASMTPAAEIPVEQLNPYLGNKLIGPAPGLYQTTEDILFTEAREQGQPRTAQRIPAGSLIVPAINAAGEIRSLQFIDGKGEKRFAVNSQKEATFHVVGVPIAQAIDTLRGQPQIVIAEGYATAATVGRSIGQPVVAAFDSGNIPAVARALHAAFPEARIVIAGDDDRHLTRRDGTPYNPGREKAELAAQEVGGQAIFPVFAEGEKGSPYTDFNDLETTSRLGRPGHAMILKSYPDQPYYDPIKAQFDALELRTLETPIAAIGEHQVHDEDQRVEHEEADAGEELALER